MLNLNTRERFLLLFFSFSLSLVHSSYWHYATDANVAVRCVQIIIRQSLHRHWNTSRNLPFGHCDLYPLQKRPVSSVIESDTYDARKISHAVKTEWNHTCSWMLLSWIYHMHYSTKYHVSESRNVIRPVLMRGKQESSIARVHLRVFLEKIN